MNDVDDDWDDLDELDDDLSAWEIMCPALPPEPPLPPLIWRPAADADVLIPDDGRAYTLAASATLVRVAGQRPVVGLQIVTDDGAVVASDMWAGPFRYGCNVRAVVNRPGTYRLAVLGERAASPFGSTDRALTAEAGGTWWP